MLRQRCLPLCLAGVMLSARRRILLEKLRAGHVVCLDNNYYRVISNGRSQKAQTTATFHVKCHLIGNPMKTKEIMGPGMQDVHDVRAERIRMLFSGFDEVDNACFVFPQFSSDAGKEVNLPAAKLPEFQQKFLACGMQCDLLKIASESDEGDDFFGDVVMPGNYVYTVDGLRKKGMYKLASFAECDGEITVGDTVNIGDRVKVLLRYDGRASYNGKAD